MTGPTELLDRVAHELEPLLTQLVFVGGAQLGGAMPARCVVQPGYGLLMECAWHIVPESVPANHATRAQLPAAWGLVLLDPDTHAVMDLVRDAQPNLHGGALTAHAVLMELWRAELLPLVRAVPGVGGVSRRTVSDLAALLVEHHGPMRARQLALETLSRRQGARVRCLRTGTVRHAAN